MKVSPLHAAEQGRILNHPPGRSLYKELIHYLLVKNAGLQCDLGFTRVSISTCFPKKVNGKYSSPT
jgi:hypothetical protein